MRFRFIRLFVSALFVATVVLAQGDAERAIGDLNDRWMELFNEGDYGSIVNLYTEDALFANPAGLHEGHEAILQHFEGPATVEGSTIQVETDEVEIFDDTAYAMGTYVVTAPDGSATLMQGAWMTIYEVVDGEWKLHRHHVHLMMPQPEADAP
jgi:uncharacterized protein (TIGR02246 family)